jgi:hypothetical protein
MKGTAVNVGNAFSLVIASYSRLFVQKANLSKVFMDAVAFVY